MTMRRTTLPAMWNFLRRAFAFEMVGRGFIQRVKFPMPGDYSVHNALAARCCDCFEN